MYQEKQILLIPGPTPIPPRVLRAMGAPAINHRGPEFKAILEECTQGVKDVIQTKEDVLILTASGTGGMEAAVASLISPGEKVLVVSIGSFGDRFVKICQAFGVEAEVMSFEWGTAADPQKVADRLAADIGHEIKAVLVQHNETSTGVLNDIQAISAARGNHPAIIVVDAISGLAAADLQADAWNLDVVIAGSQKAFMIPPGLTMVSINQRAWELAARCTNQRYYLSLSAAKDFLDKGQTPYTPAVSLLMGLQESLRMIKEDGLTASFNRHALYRDMVRAGVKALGLELLAGDGVASPAVTAIKAPGGLGPKPITTAMREKHNVVLAGGQGKLKDAIFRIGHLGYVHPNDLLAGLAALELTLKELGLFNNLGQGVAAAQEVYAGRRSN